jgi:hypothetical protein
VSHTPLDSETPGLSEALATIFDRRSLSVHAGAAEEGVAG